jgi:hypothetical protein
VISGIYKRPWEPTTGSEQRFTLTVNVIGGISRMIISQIDMLTFIPIQFPVLSNTGIFMNFPAFDFGLD